MKLAHLALTAITLALILLLAASRTMAAHSNETIVKSSFGTTPSGVPIDEYTLTNTKGLEVKIITYVLSPRCGIKKIACRILFWDSTISTTM